MKNIKYNSESLHRLTNDFRNITGVDIAVLDSEFEMISGGSVNNAFCRYVQKSCEGIKRCTLSDQELINKAKERKSVQIHTCHAGLVDILYPISDGKKIYGYVLFGRIRTNTEFEQIYDNIRDLNIDYDKIKECYNNLTSCDESYVESIMNIVRAVTTLIISGGIMLPDQEASKENVVSFVNVNLDRELTVEYLCKKFCVSKNSLYRIFKETTGTTVNGYIKQKRLEKAKQLLTETTFPVYEIAKRCGIKNYTYFFKLIKDNEHTTPSDYRRANKKN